MKITKLVVHHSASPRQTTTRKLIDQWHRDKGYKQIGYHQVIEGAGNVVAGRPETMLGAHALGANSGSLGVCVVGNFETETPSDAQIQSLVAVLTRWCKSHKLKVGVIYGHYNVPGGKTATACPGKNLISQLPAIRQMVNMSLSKTLYAIESRIKDAGVKLAVRKALQGDGRFGHNEIKAIIRSTFDGGAVTPQELADVRQILEHSTSLEKESKELIASFLRNPNSIKNQL